MSHIPSYDDLTPGIPDVLDSESVSQLTLFLRPDLNRRSGDQEKSGKTTNQDSPDLLNSCKPITLYACLRQQTADGEPRTANCKLLAVARDFSPRVMVASDREVLLDVSGLGRLIGDPPAIALELARALFGAGVEARVAIAPTQTAARLLAAARPERPGLRDYIDDLPVSLLQPLEALPPAMNHRDRIRPYETFERWGIATLGDLAALPVAELSSRLGRRGVALHRLARGLDSAPFVPDGETPRFLARLELEWPLETLEPLSFVFARLLDPLSAALDRADRGAIAVHLDLRLTDRSTHTRVLPLPAPMRDPRVLRTLLLLDLESHSPSAAVDIVAIELDPAPARITQFSLLQRALPSPETLSTLTARLSALLGDTRIGSPVLLDTHQPGAFQMQPFKPESTVRIDPPVGPTFRSGVLRRQRHPPAIRVSVEHGRPVYIAAARRGMPQGAVIQAAGPWRTSGGWWVSDACRAEEADARRGVGKTADACRAGAADAGRAGGTDARRAADAHACRAGWNRDEWDVALSSGAVCRIFQDRTTERWFLDGTYD
jgi:protein ImuB